MKLATQAPKIGKKLPVGHHLGILPDKYANSLPRPDGSPPWHAPPSPFNRKQWLGGSFIISEKSPPRVGINFLMKGIYLALKQSKVEVRENTRVTRTIEIRQRLIFSQWYPSKTDLIIEERLTGYSSQPYDSSEINTTSLIPPKVGILSFVFDPNPSMLQAFANLCEDTHRIHFDRAYAISEGYPDLVVQVPLQLIVILDVMMAYIPDGLLFRAVDYRVINPLCYGRQIKVYRQWIHGVEKEDDTPVTLDDLSARTTPPMFKFQLQDASKDPERVPRPAHRRRQGQRVRNKRMALFWTATDDGTVGIVALVILIPRPGKVVWNLESEGYLSRQGGLKSRRLSKSKDTLHQDDCNGEDDPAADSEKHYCTSTEPFPRFDGMSGFDSLGRPTTDGIVPGEELSIDQSHHPWSLRDVDEVALEEERLERSKKAKALVKSQDLLRRLFDNEDEDFMI